MALINHCRYFKPAALYRISDIKGYKQVYLYEGKCPVCKKDAYGWFGVDIWGNRYPQDGLNIVCKKTKSQWVKYIVDGEAIKVERPDKDAKDMRARPIVGEGTLMMSRPVERVYKKILWAVSIRSEASAKELKNI